MNEPEDDVFAAYVKQKKSSTSAKEPTYTRGQKLVGGIVDGVVTSLKGDARGNGRRHGDGSISTVDIAAPKGTPVKWERDEPGEVVFAGKKGGYGNLVEVKVGDKKRRLAHLDVINVKVGDTVGKGVEIGRVGNTGRVRKSPGGDGSHLHDEWRNITPASTGPKNGSQSDTPLNNDVFANYVAQRKATTPAEAPKMLDLPPGFTDVPYSEGPLDAETSDLRQRVERGASARVMRSQDFVGDRKNERLKSFLGLEHQYPRGLVEQGPKIPFTKDPVARPAGRTAPKAVAPVGQGSLRGATPPPAGATLPLPNVDPRDSRAMRPDFGTPEPPVAPPQAQTALPQADRRAMQPDFSDQSASLATPPVPFVRDGAPQTGAGGVFASGRIGEAPIPVPMVPGNIDLTNRPVVRNEDGSVSTVRSISINQDGREILIPTVIDGQVVSNEEAIDAFHRTGQHLGVFANAEDANAYAEKLHEQQQAMYAPVPDPREAQADWGDVNAPRPELPMPNVDPNDPRAMRDDGSSSFKQPGSLEAIMDGAPLPQPDAEGRLPFQNGRFSGTEYSDIESGLGVQSMPTDISGVLPAIEAHSVYLSPPNEQGTRRLRIPVPTDPKLLTRDYLERFAAQHAVDVGPESFVKLREKGTLPIVPTIPTADGGQIPIPDDATLQRMYAEAQTTKFAKHRRIAELEGANSRGTISVEEKAELADLKAWEANGAVGQAEGPDGSLVNLLDAGGNYQMDLTAQAIESARRIAGTPGEMPAMYDPYEPLPFQFLTPGEKAFQPTAEVISQVTSHPFRSTSAPFTAPLNAFFSGSERQMQEYEALTGKTREELVPVLDSNKVRTIFNLGTGIVRGASFGQIEAPHLEGLPGRPYALLANKAGQTGETIGESAWFFVPAGRAVEVVANGRKLARGLTWLVGEERAIKMLASPIGREMATSALLLGGTEAAKGMKEGESFTAYGKRVGVGAFTGAVFPMVRKMLPAGLNETVKSSLTFAIVKNVVPKVFGGESQKLPIFNDPELDQIANWGLDLLEGAVFHKGMEVGGRPSRSTYDLKSYEKVGDKWVPDLSGFRPLGDHGRLITTTQRDGTVLRGTFDPVTGKWKEVTEKEWKSWGEPESDFAVTADHFRDMFPHGEMGVRTDLTRRSRRWAEGYFRGAEPSGPNVLKADEKVDYIPVRGEGADSSLNPFSEGTSARTLADSSGRVITPKTLKERTPAPELTIPATSEGQKRAQEELEAAIRGISLDEASGGRGQIFEPTLGPAPSGGRGGRAAVIERYYTRDDSGNLMPREGVGGKGFAADSPISRLYEMDPKTGNITPKAYEPGEALPPRVARFYTMDEDGNLVPKQNVAPNGAITGPLSRYYRKDKDGNLKPLSIDEQLIGALDRESDSADTLTRANAVLDLHERIAARRDSLVAHQANIEEALQSDDEETRQEAQRQQVSIANEIADLDFALKHSLGLAESDDLPEDATERIVKYRDRIAGLNEADKAEVERLRARRNAPKRPKFNPLTAEIPEPASRAPVTYDVPLTPANVEAARTRLGQLDQKIEGLGAKIALEGGKNARLDLRKQHEKLITQRAKLAARLEQPTGTQPVTEAPTQPDLVTSATPEAEAAPDSAPPISPPVAPPAAPKPQTPSERIFNPGRDIPGYMERFHPDSTKSFKKMRGMQVGKIASRLNRSKANWLNAMVFNEANGQEGEILRNLEQMGIAQKAWDAKGEVYWAAAGKPLPGTLTRDETAFGADGTQAPRPDAFADNLDTTPKSPLHNLARTIANTVGGQILDNATIENEVAPIFGLLSSNERTLSSIEANLPEDFRSPHDKRGAVNVRGWLENAVNAGFAKKRYDSKSGEDYYSLTKKGVEALGENGDQAPQPGTFGERPAEEDSISLPHPKYPTPLAQIKVGKFANGWSAVTDFMLPTGGSSTPLTSTVNMNLHATKDEAVQAALVRLKDEVEKFLARNKKPADQKEGAKILKWIASQQKAAPVSTSESDDAADDGEKNYLTALAGLRELNGNLSRSRDLGEARIGNLKKQHGLKVEKKSDVLSDAQVRRGENPGTTYTITIPRPSGDGVFQVRWEPTPVDQFNGVGARPSINDGRWGQVNEITGKEQTQQQTLPKIGDTRPVKGKMARVVAAMRTKESDVILYAATDGSAAFIRMVDRDSGEEFMVREFPTLEKARAAYKHAVESNKATGTYESSEEESEAPPEPVAAPEPQAGKEGRPQAAYAELARTIFRETRPSMTQAAMDESPLPPILQALHENTSMSLGELYKAFDRKWNSGKLLDYIDQAIAADMVDFSVEDDEKQYSLSVDALEILDKPIPAAETKPAPAPKPQQEKPKEISLTDFVLDPETGEYGPPGGYEPGETPAIVNRLAELEAVDMAAAEKALAEAAEIVKAEGKIDVAEAIAILKGRRKGGSGSGMASDLRPGESRVASILDDFDLLLAIAVGTVQGGTTVLSDWTSEFLDTITTHMGEDYADEVWPFVPMIYRQAKSIVDAETVDKPDVSAETIEQEGEDSERAANSGSDTGTQGASGAVQPAVDGEDAGEGSDASGSDSGTDDGRSETATSGEGGATGQGVPDGTGSGTGTDARPGTTGGRTGGGRKPSRKPKPTVDTGDVEVPTTEGSSEKPVAPSTVHTGKPISKGKMFRADATDLESWLNRTASTDKGSEKKNQRFRANLEAIDTARTLIATNEAPTAEQQLALAKYTGWGMFPEVWNGQADTQWMRDELEKRLTPKENSQAQESTTNAHYTSAAVVREIWKAVDRLGFKGGRILEPSVGTGNFFGWMPDSVLNHDRTRLVGVELDTTTAMITKLLYPNADVLNTGFEDTKIDNNTFDLAISNVPFGPYRIFDPEINARYGERTGLRIHNYFFARSMNLVRPGGLVVFITSTGTMDTTTGKAFRETLARNAELVAAYRLPMETFKANAGTEVTADIIILRKKGGAGADLNADDQDFWLHAPTNMYTPPDMAYWEAAQYFKGNPYFRENPDNVLGEWTKAKTSQGFRLGVKTRAGEDGMRLLRTQMAKLPRHVYKTSEKAADESKPLATVKKDTDYFEQKKIGRLTSDTDEKGKKTIYVETPDGREIATIPAAAQKRVLDYIDIRDAMLESIATQLANKPAAEKEGARAALKKAYESFVKQHGPVNSSKNVRSYAGDPEVALVLAMEQLGEDKKTWSVRKELFEGDTINVYEPPTRADDLESALRISLLEHDAVDLTRIAGLLGRTEDEVRDAILEQRLAYQDPTSPNLIVAEEYLSGDLGKKIADVKARVKLSPSLAINLADLELALPEQKTPEAIAKSTRIGANYISVEDVMYFSQQELGIVADIRYVDIAARWAIDPDEIRIIDGVKAFSKYGTRDLNSGLLLRKALNNERPRVYRTDDEGNRYLDVTATAQAELKMRDIIDVFQTWMIADPERAERITKTFNERYNSVKRRTHSTERLDVTGVAPHVLDMLRPYQNSGARQIGSGRNALLAHDMGGGKTLTSAVGAALMLQRGVAKKIAFIALPSTLKQVEAEYRRAMPGARILTVDDKKFDAKNRARFLATIATSSYDVVIIPSSSFTRIGVAPERYISYLQGILDDLIAALRDEDPRRADAMEAWVNDPGADKPPKLGRPTASVKIIEQQIKSFRAKMRRKRLILAERAKNKDKVLNFEELGFDALIVDESHNFKALPFVTHLGRLSGVGGGRESERAEDLYLKIQHINEVRGGDSGITFLTGTPVTNTLGELYTIMRFLAPSMLRRMKITHFDAFVANFATTETTLEANVIGRFRAKERLKRFVNGYELFRMNSTFTDVQTAEMLDLPKPKLEDFEGAEKPIPVELEMAPAMQEYNRDLDRRVREIELHPEWQGTPGEDNMLSVTSDGRMSALDVRMGLGSTYGLTELSDGGTLAFIDKHSGNPNNKIGWAADPLHVGSKAEAIASNIISEYRKGNDRKVTQVVFADLGVPNKDKPGSFNFYDAVRDDLISQGIPPGEIAYYQDYNTDEKKQQLFEDFNSGKIRVLFGTTLALGTGTNIQRRLGAIHFATIPWRPTDLEQSRARMVRQGNLHLEWNLPVREFQYITKGLPGGGRASFDTYQWQTVAAKLTMLNQYWTGGADQIDDITDTHYTVQEWVAIGSGNPYAMEQVQVTRDIAELEKKLEAHRANVESAATLQRQYMRDVDYYEKKIAEAGPDLESANKAQTSPDAALTERWPILLEGASKPEIAKKLLPDIRKLFEKEVEAGRMTFPIGTIGDLTVKARAVRVVPYPQTNFAHTDGVIKWWDKTVPDSDGFKADAKMLEFEVVITGKGETKSFPYKTFLHLAEVPAGVPADTFAAADARVENEIRKSLQYAFDDLRSLEKNIGIWTEQVETSKQRVASAQEEIDRPFPDMETLVNKYERLRFLEHEMGRDVSEIVNDEALSGDDETDTETETPETPTPPKGDGFTLAPKPRRPKVDPEARRERDVARLEALRERLGNQISDSFDYEIRREAVNDKVEIPVDATMVDKTKEVAKLLAEKMGDTSPEAVEYVEDWLNGDDDRHVYDDYFDDIDYTGIFTEDHQTNIVTMLGEITKSTDETARHEALAKELRVPATTPIPTLVTLAAEKFEAGTFEEPIRMMVEDWLVGLDIENTDYTDIGDDTGEPGSLAGGTTFNVTENGVEAGEAGRTPRRTGTNMLLTPSNSKEMAGEVKLAGLPWYGRTAVDKKEMDAILLDVYSDVPPWGVAGVHYREPHHDWEAPTIFVTTKHMLDLYNLIEQKKGLHRVRDLNFGGISYSLRKTDFFHSLDYFAMQANVRSRDEDEVPSDWEKIQEILVTAVGDARRTSGSVNFVVTDRPDYRFGGTVVTSRAMVAEIYRHEQSHAVQRYLAKVFKALERKKAPSEIRSSGETAYIPEHFIDSVPGIDKVLDRLMTPGSVYENYSKRGMAMEVFSHLLTSNDVGYLGLTQFEAMQMLRHFYDAILERHGEAGLEMFIQYATPAAKEATSEKTEEIAQARARERADARKRSEASEGVSRRKRWEKGSVLDGVQKPGEGSDSGAEESLASGVQPPPADTQLDPIRKVQKASENPTVRERIHKAIDAMSKPKDYGTYLLNLGAQTDKLVMKSMTQNGIMPPSANPTAVNNIAFGGAAGMVEATLLDYGDVWKRARKAHLEEHLERLLNLKGYRRAYVTKREHVADTILSFAEYAVDKMPQGVWDRLERDGVISDAERRYIQGVASSRAKTTRNPSINTPIPTNLVNLIWDHISQKMWESAARYRMSPKGYVDFMARRAKDRKEVANTKNRMRTGAIVPHNILEKQIPHKIQALKRTLTAKQLAQLEEMEKAVYEINRQMWDLAHSVGIISTKVYKRTTDRGDEYIPLSRIMDSLGAGKQRNKYHRQGLDLAQQEILYKLEGSERINVPPIIASMARAAETIREAARNHAARTFINLRHRDPVLASTIFQLKDGQEPADGYAALNVYIDGKKTQWQVPDFVEWEMGLATAQQVELIGGAAINFFNHLFKSGATGMNLAFALPNLARDVRDYTRFAEHAPRLYRPDQMVTFALQWGASFYRVIRKNGAYREWLRSGGAFSTLQKQLTPNAFLNGMLYQAAQSPWRVLAAPYLAVGKFVNAIEESTKLTAYKRALSANRRDGMSEADSVVAAVYESRAFGGSPDFAIGGSYGQQVNLLYPFFRASLAGIRRNVRWGIGRDMYMPGARGGIGNTGGLPPRTPLNQLSSMVGGSFGRGGGDGGGGVWAPILGTPDANKNATVMNSRRHVAALMRFAMHAFWMALAAMSYYEFHLKDYEDDYEDVLRSDREKNWIFFKPYTQVDAKGKTYRPYDKVPMSHFDQLFFPVILDVLRWAKGKDVDMTDTARREAEMFSPLTVNSKPDEPLLRSLARAAVSNASPILREPVEQGMNWDTFRDIPIESPWMEKVDPTRRKTAKTSVVAVTLAEYGDALIRRFSGQPKNLFFNSPVRIQRFINSITGGASELPLGIIDAMNENRAPDESAEDRLRSMPVIGPLVRRFIGSAKSQRELDATERFYNAYRMADAGINTFRHDGREYGVEAARKFLEKPENFLRAAFAGELDDMVAAQSEIRKGYNLIADNPDLSQDVKLEALRKLNEQETALLKRSDEINRLMRSGDIEKAANDLTVLTFRYNSEVELEKFRLLEEVTSSPAFRAIADPRVQGEIIKKLERKVDSMRLSRIDPEKDERKQSKALERDQKNFELLREGRVQDGDRKRDLYDWLFDE